MGTAFPSQRTFERGHLNAPLTFGSHGHILTYRSFSKLSREGVWMPPGIYFYSHECEYGVHPSHTPRIKKKQGRR